MKKDIAIDRKNENKSHKPTYHEQQQWQKYKRLWY